MNNNNRVKIYLDQFVRISFLYKIIEERNIKYDYIIRARIDQYIDYNVLNTTFKLLNNRETIYPIISSNMENMDNLFIIGRTHFNFFYYIINNIGFKNLNYTDINDKYILGPEVQFNALVKSYFTNITHFNTYVSNFEIAFGASDITNNCYYLYSSKHVNGICFGQYISNLKINKDNYSEKFSKDDNFKCIKYPNCLKKYHDIIYCFYTIRSTDN